MSYSANRKTDDLFSVLLRLPERSDIGSWLKTVDMFSQMSLDGLDASVEAN
jgi:hypothetical protein